MEEMEEMNSPLKIEKKNPLVPVFDANTMASLAQATDSFDSNGALTSYRTVGEDVFPSPRSQGIKFEDGEDSDAEMVL